ncbi:MAG: hypothetical protein LQ346_008399 [Caloplaca aetnensis]|nr:MAG: hypothetical protein LQ346_008399 [Caloplaca aetnensis]
MNVNGQRHDRIAAVTYGSETGNSLEYAEEAGRTLERLHFQTIVQPLDALEPTNPGKLSLSRFNFVIVIVSTTGQGDLPANARSFWRKLLRKKLPPDHLQDVSFATFGLGDSSYPQFNWAVRKLHKRLLQLGACELHSRGEADEQHEEGSDASWVPWIARLRQQILVHYPLDDGVEPIPPEVLLQPKWLLSSIQNQSTSNLEPPGGADRGTQPEVELQSIAGDKLVAGLDRAIPVNPPGSNHRSLVIQLQENRRLTPSDHWQDVRHLRFSCASPVDYAPGDVLTLMPENASIDVDQFLERMDWTRQADQVICFEPTSNVLETDFYPRPLVTVNHQCSRLTLRKLLQYHLDIRAVPRRSFFAMVAHFTNDEMHKQRLLEFTDPQYIDELFDYTTRPRRSILEVLQEFHSIKIPWQWAANVLPELRGRQFSIASGGSRKHLGEGLTNFELLVAIVKYRTVIKTLREGVCTRYLAGLPQGATMEATLQKGGLNIQKSEATRPVILIGPGTGLAPMRSLIWERYQWYLSIPGIALGETILFYGCRNQAADFFYREEWEFLEEKMPLRVFAAFSRDQKAKFYVQDILRQQAKLVYELLYSRRGLVYVCGSSGMMPKAVRTALVDVFRSYGDMGESLAKDYLRTMEKEGRYKQEVSNIPKYLKSIL